MSACAHKESDYNFEKIHSVKIDESKIVLSKFPSELTEINDSTVGVIASQKLSLYNIYSGRNIANFSAQTIKFDSLIRETFQKKYSGKREYNYDPASAGGLKGGNCQLTSFYYSNNAFYIYVNTLAQVKYINDSVGLAQYTENDRVKEAQKKYGKDMHVKIMEFVEFIFVVDNDFHLKKIIPLYENEQLKKDNYQPYYFKGFIINNDKMLFSILKRSEPVEKITSKMTPGKSYYTLADIGLENDNDVNYKLSFKDVDFSDFSLHDYFSSAFVFQQNSNVLIMSTGKEIYNVETGVRLFSKEHLKSNEWIQAFHYDNDKNLIAVTSCHFKKAHPTILEATYDIDSVGEIKIKMFEAKKSTWTDEKNIENKKNLSFLITKNKVVYFDKDKENYYFKYIKYYNEN